MEQSTELAEILDDGPRPLWGPRKKGWGGPGLPVGLSWELRGIWVCGGHLCRMRRVVSETDVGRSYPDPTLSLGIAGWSCHQGTGPNDTPYRELT